MCALEDIDRLSEFQASVEGIAALADPTRRRLYLYVAAQPDAVSRDEIVAGTGVASHRAKFHLERLMADGLLEAEFRHRGERRGPGSGRPAKFYRRPERTVSVSLPSRRYQLAGEVLAAAVSRAGEGEDLAFAVKDESEQAGRAIGAAALVGPAGKDLMEVLSRVGYEPRMTGGHLVMANCPFHELAEAHREVICGMNLAFVAGICAALDEHSTARLEPHSETCCVRIEVG
jgi:predicted ArsR family transcriptional regulator